MNIKEVIYFVEKLLTAESNALINEIRCIQKDVDYRKLKFADGKGVTYDFSDYTTFKELFRDIYYRNMSINKAERKQNEFNAALSVLSGYSPRDENILR